jgi:amidophosphoribosyltransferase
MPLPAHPFDDDKLREECGVFGVIGVQDAATFVALGLHALQHRGQEAAGIVAYAPDEGFTSARRFGYVRDNFTSPSLMETLPGSLAIGHVRYSTAGSKGNTQIRDVQPLFAEFAMGGAAIAHNGNLTNALSLREELIERGSIFQSGSDTECIIHLMARSIQKTIPERMKDALRRVEGAFSIVAMTRSKLIGVRDPLGVRLLMLGRVGEGWVLASETCALDIIGAEFVRDIEAGEMVVLDESGVHSLRPFPPAQRRPCIFEYIYFARPDSLMEGISIYQTRKDIGAVLAEESGVPADVVIPVPDSGVPGAIGYSERSGISFELGIIRNHYVGRTFIEPGQQIRNLGVKLKHNANRRSIEGKRVILVDDSIVRGTTSIKIVEMVRAAGAKEVHMRIAAPPTTHSCFYGIDTPERDELLASRLDVEGMARHIGVDSLAFITIDGLYRAMGQPGRVAAAPKYCDACFTGDYPIRLTDFAGRDQPAQLSLLAERA